MRQGAIAILPLAVGVVIYGFAFGLLAAQMGFPWWSVGLMSAAVHAGSSQIVAVEQFSGSSAVLGAALAGAALNLRYIGIIASLSELLNGLPLRMKLLAIHITGDENWALTMSERAKSKDVGASFLIGSGLVLISVWTASTAGGHWSVLLCLTWSNSGLASLLLPPSLQWLVDYGGDIPTSYLGPSRLELQVQLFGWVYQRPTP
ncbi:AzlC family ABC transporter permease [Paracoccaceae bacterium]|nr:AzlC family ABC transporter permease [Paracoccaceae bacterium]